MPFVSYIKIVRPINIVIVFLTQFLLYYLCVFRFVDAPALSYSLVILLSLCTCIITASGYIINDYYDADIDKINKPNLHFVGKTISKRTALSYYILLVSLGFILSCFIAWRTNNMPLLPIYPLAQVLLYYYARKGKLLGFVGNNIVALMTCFVSLIIIVAERKILFTTEHKTSLLLIIAFGIFSYFINLCREVVKDIEDMDGDTIKNVRSIALVAGIDKAKAVIYFNGGLLIVLIIAFIIWFPQISLSKLFGIIFIVGPLGFVFYTLSESKEKKEFSTVSKYLKYLMFVGLIYLFLITFTLTQLI